MKRTIELELTKSFTVEQLQEFANAVPAGAALETVVRVTPKDRPWESEVTRVTLTASWTDK